MGYTCINLHKSKDTLYFNYFHFFTVYEIINRIIK